ncbi:MAG: hypothetical protein COT73_00010 [Bdellovibrio sp. CG10_big_fil_rev_8_21_14_0_10_47_8]|nr:MAG: hypothetical protein COT73_00010 [Bdellovibrio sp. CG10_big_fil_rev_8_21_14_0_10_47_8]
MKKVLVISTTLDEQETIEDIALHHSPGSMSVETSASFGQDITFWSTQAPDVLVINLPEDDLLQGYYFTKLRKDVLKTQPVLFLCSTISASLMKMSTNFSKVRMLKTPVDGYALYRTLIDLTAEFKDGQRQVHPRYLTDQVVEVRSDYHEGKAAGVMKNLSMGGVYFEIEEKGFEIKPGDMVRLSVFVGRPQKLYVFDAKIVWMNTKDPSRVGYGCAFVDKNEVYNQLLKFV